MPNTYIQVMLTYLRHPFGVLQRYLLISIILYIFAMLFLPSILIEKHICVSIILLLFMILFSCWTIHAKEQFADARASLTPGFRKVHGIVSIIVALVFVVLLPGVVALLINWQTIGLVSLMTFLFGIILWTILRLGNTFLSLIAAVWIFTLFEQIQSSIEKIASGNALIFLGVGAVLSITGIIRLFLLNEEKPEYNLNLKFSIYDSQGWRRWFTNRRAVRMIYHSRHATDSYWSRILRWNFSNSPVWSALFHAAYINLSLMLFYFLTDETFLPEIRLLVATLMPLFLVIRQFNKKSRFMAQDLMMPVRRDTYLKQVAMSFITHQLIWWGAFMTVTVLLIFTSVAKPAPEFLFISISYSLMAQIGSFGLVIWISSFGSTILNFFNFLIITKVFFYVMIPFISYFNKLTLIPWWSLLLGVFYAALGLELASCGYDRWMVKDFDS